MAPNVEKDISVQSKNGSGGAAAGTHHMLNPFVHKLELVDSAEKIKVSAKKAHLMSI